MLTGPVGFGRAEAGGLRRRWWHLLLDPLSDTVHRPTVPSSGWANCWVGLHLWWPGGQGPGTPGSGGVPYLDEGRGLVCVHVRHPHSTLPLEKMGCAHCQSAVTADNDNTVREAQGQRASAPGRCGSDASLSVPCWDPRGSAVS